MVVRNDGDVDVDWFLSPRIIRVRAPSTEITLQDLHDTAREREQRIDNLVYDSLIASAGKEDLGGSVAVGITSTLQNAKVAFDARKISVASGTVTVDDLTGRILVDGYAMFITDGVTAGATVMNLTDESICSVIQVLSETRLLTDYLGDGYDNQFETGDSYKIWNTIQCNISGGNLVAVDGYGSSTSPVLPTAATQVVRTASSSATLLDSEALQAASFFGGVTVDVTSSYSGTGFPIGTPQQPVNNLSDAILIANEHGLSTIFVNGSLIIGSNVSGFTFIGTNVVTSAAVVLPGASTNNTTFQRINVSGTTDGYTVVENCGISNITGNNITFSQCLFFGTVTIDGPDITVNVLDCWSGVPGFTTPIFDFNGGDASMVVRNYFGGIDLRNKTGPMPVSIDMSAGSVILDSTVTDGTFVVRGVGTIVNNSSASVTFTGLTNPNTVSNATLKKVLPFLPE